MQKRSENGYVVLEVLIFILIWLLFNGFMPESILIYFEGLDARIQFDWFDVIIYFPSFWGVWCKNWFWFILSQNWFWFWFILSGLMQDLILIYFEPELILILIHFERFDARIDCLWFDGITSVAGTSGHNIGWGYWIILNEQTNKHTLGDVGRWIILNQQTNKYWSRFLNNLQYQPIGRSHENLSNNRE